MQAKGYFFGKLSDMAVSYEMLCRKNNEYVQILKNYQDCPKVVDASRNVWCTGNVTKKFSAMMVEWEEIL